MNASEKMGPRPVNARRISKLCCMIKDCGLFEVYHLPMMKSDHTPILAILTSNRPKPQRIFIFEN